MANVPDFAELEQRFQIAIQVNQLSPKTFRNYISALGRICLHFGKTPEYITQSELDYYLADLNQNRSGTSKARLKMCVFGLRFYFNKILRIPSNLVFPSIIQRRSLPVVFSRSDCKKLFFVTKNLKHRAILTLTYSAGLRISEVCKLQLHDIDFDRMTITVRQGKGGKDRCIPLAELMKKGLLRYIDFFHPTSYLFFGMNSKTDQYWVKSIQNILKKAIRLSGIQKPGASVHTLRHSFATHLLENGTNIVKIQQLMGHSNIQTTMIYTRLVNTSFGKVVSPIDSLYQS
ncbi:Site-specific recombinase XerD [Spirosomataceae bacterium TFI 002]|nr:Site-specific recombinase XerD [Spirosomataceae bacterium TFI 002]